MNANVNIRFTPDGTGECLYTDMLDLREIGTLRIKRATSIEFDDRTQRWVVWNPYGRRLFSNTSRQCCLDWEQEHFGKDKE